MESKVKVENVSKWYAKKRVLDNCSWTVPMGEIIGLVGKNGVGKTTLLQLMAGLKKPNQGTLSINGKAIDRTSSASVRYVSKESSFYPFMSVEKWIDYYRLQHPSFNDVKWTELKKWMPIVKGQKMGKCSKGEQKVINLALALACDVPYLLLDEPLSGLDQHIRQAWINSIIAIFEPEKQTIIIATHDVLELEPLFDCLVLLRDGKIEKTVRVEKLQNDGYTCGTWLRQELAPSDRES